MRRDRGDGGAGRREDDQPPGRARSRAGPRGRHLGLVVRREPARRPARGEDGLFAGWTERAARRRRRRPRDRQRSQQVQENKYYADLGGSSITQQRVRLEPTFEVHGTDEASRRLRLDAHHRAAGRARLGVLHRRAPSTSTPSAPSSPTCWREARRAQRPGRHLRPGDPSLQPVADHPRVDRPRHRARPRAGLRGQLRRHLVRDATTSSARSPTAPPSCTSPATAPSSTACPPSGTTTRASRPSQWDIVRDGVLVGYQLDREMAHTYGAELNGGRSNGCAYADSPGHIPIQRMANVSLQPAADGPDTDGADQPGRARHLRRRRQVVVDRHAALQLPVHRPAVLPDRGRRAQGPAARRRLPGDHHRLLGLDGGRRRTRRPTCSAARSTAARPSPARSPRSATAARRRCSATSGS